MNPVVLSVRMALIASYFETGCRTDWKKIRKYGLVGGEQVKAGSEISKY